MACPRSYVRNHIGVAALRDKARTAWPLKAASMMHTPLAAAETLLTHEGGVTAKSTSHLASPANDSASCDR